MYRVFFAISMTALVGFAAIKWSPCDYEVRVKKNFDKQMKSYAMNNVQILK